MRFPSSSPRMRKGVTNGDGEYRITSFTRRHFSTWTRPPKPTSRTIKKQRYANSIRVTDEYLRTFFRELHRRDRLTNSIVFITGDHSFPVGEHGYYDNESGFYNEYFKTPLLIWGKGIPAGISHELHSQLDIAPTVLELLGI